jgi:uncharacterized protein DUF4266
MNTRRHWLIAALLLVTVGTSGCATVRPWDRDLLARKSMRFVPLPHEMAADDHIYFSKEGSTGGMDAAGGGCGCN